MKVTIETLKQILDAFNRHNLDAIMEFFSDDCSFDFPGGPELWGQRFIGKAQVRNALAWLQDINFMTLSIRIPVVTNKFRGSPDS